MEDVTKACRDIEELAPLAQQACNLFLNECKKQDIDVFITETYRSQARQDYLHAQGRDRPGQIVTWTKNSNHTGRMAWDIAVNPPKNLYDVATLNRAGQVAKQLGITWGGNWQIQDRPHFEIKENWQVPEGATDMKVEQKPIKVNGKVKTANMVNIDGNNYVKLQDLADRNIVIGYSDKMPTVDSKMERVENVAVNKEKRTVSIVPEGGPRANPEVVKYAENGNRITFTWQDGFQTTGTIE